MTASKRRPEENPDRGGERRADIALRRKRSFELSRGVFHRPQIRSIQPVAYSSGFGRAFYLPIMSAAGTAPNRAGNGGCRPTLSLRLLSSKSRSLREHSAGYIVAPLIVEIPFAQGSSADYIVAPLIVEIPFAQGSSADYIVAPLIVEIPFAQGASADYIAAPLIVKIPFAQGSSAAHIVTPLIVEIPFAQGSSAAHIVTPLIVEIPFAQGASADYIVAPLIVEIPFAQGASAGHIVAPLIVEIPFAQGASADYIVAPLIVEIPFAQGASADYIVAPLIVEIPFAQARALTEFAFSLMPWPSKRSFAEAVDMKTDVADQVFRWEVDGFAVRTRRKFAFSNRRRRSPERAGFRE